MAKLTEQQLKDQWRETVSAYRHRHRMWTMSALPAMSDAEWEEYTQWVADFGGSLQRKLKRRLSAKRGLHVTATVTNISMRATRRS